MRISVVIPVYNVEKYLSETLDSILDQSLKEIEIICVDDGSTDNSVRILEEYQEKDDRLKILHQTEESDGAAKARNLGIDKATGEYLAILDADDIFESNMLEEAYEMAIRTNSEIVAFGATFYNTLYDEDLYSGGLGINSMFRESDTVDPRQFPKSLFQRFQGSAWTYIFNRDFIERNNIRFFPVHVTDDLEFTYVALASAKSVAGINKRFVHYRRDAVGNQTSNLDKHPETGWRAFLHFKENLMERGLYEYYKVTYAKMMLRTTCENYLRVMGETENFERLFYALKNEYLVSLGAFDISDEDYGSDALVNKRNSIMNDSAEQFLLNCVRRSSHYIYDEMCIRLPRAYLSKKSIRVAIYGGGLWGKAVFGNIVGLDNIRLVHWVDIKYAEYGYPFENPEVLKDHEEYDIVYVAITHPEMIEEAEKYLSENLGIPKEKILHVNTY